MSQEEEAEPGLKALVYLNDLLIILLLMHLNSSPAQEENAAASESPAIEIAQGKEKKSIAPPGRGDELLRLVVRLKADGTLLLGDESLSMPDVVARAHVRRAVKLVLRADADTPYAVSLRIITALSRAGFAVELG